MLPLLPSVTDFLPHVAPLTLCNSFLTPDAPLTLCDGPLPGPALGPGGGGGCGGLHGLALALDQAVAVGEQRQPRLVAVLNAAVDLGVQEVQAGDGT